MAYIGNHMKTTVHPDLRERVFIFYRDILGGEILPIDKANFDLFRFSNNFILGVTYSTDCLTEKQFLNAMWCEIKTNNVSQLKEKLINFGVKEVEYEDKAHFYFQAPGGQVYRIVEENE